MSSRIAVVTGANKGIGFEVVKQLCDSGFKTIMACRNESLGTNAMELLRAEGYNVEFRSLDISDSNSIKKFKEGIESSYDHVDLLVNNAGIAFKAADPTPFHLQSRPTLAVNYFGTMHFTLAMLPLLLKGIAMGCDFAPRIVNVASMAGHLKILKSDVLRAKFTSDKLTIEELNSLMEQFVSDVEATGNTDTSCAATNEQQQVLFDKGWPSSNYGISKLGVIALTKILAKQYPQLLCNCCCPGYCDTDMSSHRGIQTAAVGAKTVVAAAQLSASNITDTTTTGAFYQNEAVCSW